LPSYGLVVRNLSNQIVFSSNDTPLKIINTHTSSLSRTSSYVDITVSDADNNYFFLTDFSWDLYSEHVGGDDYAYFFKARGFYKTSSTNIRIEKFIFESGVTGGLLGPDYAWTDAFTLLELKS